MKFKNKSKRALSAALTLILALSLFAGCGNKVSENLNPTGTSAPTESPAPTATMTPAPTFTTTPSPTPDPDAGIIFFDGTEIEGTKHLSSNGAETSDNGVIHKELTSVELAALMGNGTNLGNTMEACDTNKMKYSDNPKDYETSWGQPETTAEMIAAMKEAGFDTLRIPVAWITNATTVYENGDTTISEAYFDRVEEIINYALDADMYVIINDHWDGGWWSMFGSANEETRNKAMEIFVSMWTQIANRYKEYSDRLIFEGANEELSGRFNNNTAYCSDANDLYFTEDDIYELTNKINQTFVDTVRATGGNNKYRFLLIPGYDTNIAKTTSDKFIMPTDTAENKLLISVHFYDPWSYCGDGQSTVKWGTKNDFNTMEETLSKMTKFTEKGYGVVIGEYGVLHDTELQENTVSYHTYFLSLCDIYGYTSCLWDASGFFIRKNLTMIDKDFAKLYKNNNYEMFDGMTQAEINQIASRRMKKLLDAAPETFRTDVIELTDTTAVSWIMWNSSDYSCTYSVGDTYNPDSISEGIKLTEVEVTGEGTYTVGLDFTATASGLSDGIAFAALAIGNGKLLYPDYVIDIKECLINGEPYTFIAKPYTTSDDGKCTRINLYNEWVTTIPDGAITIDGSLDGCAASIIDPTLDIKTIQITYYYGPAK